MTEANVLQWDGTGLALLCRRVVTSGCRRPHQQMKRRDGDGTY